MKLVSQKFTVDIPDSEPTERVDGYPDVLEKRLKFPIGHFGTSESPSLPVKKRYRLEIEGDVRTGMDHVFENAGIHSHFELGNFPEKSDIGAIIISGDFHGDLGVIQENTGVKSGNESALAGCQCQAGKFQIFRRDQNPAQHDHQKDNEHFFHQYLHALSVNLF